MHRLLFERTGTAAYMSHLDLMRVFQRAFRRAGLLLRHTGGFNQHAYVSLALPLSVGTESLCELLDYELETELPAGELPGRLNAVLPAGITVRSAFESDRKLRELTRLHAQVFLEYDIPVPAGAEDAIRALFAEPSVTVMKRGKNGETELDLRPMLFALEVCRPDAQTVCLDAVVAAQNPSLNPMLLAAAVEAKLPAYKPAFARCRRIEMLDSAGKAFR